MRREPVRVTQTHIPRPARCVRTLLSPDLCARAPCGLQRNELTPLGARTSSLQRDGAEVLARSLRNDAVPRWTSDHQGHDGSDGCEKSVCQVRRELANRAIVRLVLIARLAHSAIPKRLMLAQGVCFSWDRSGPQIPHFVSGRTVTRVIYSRFRPVAGLRSHSIGRFLRL